MLLLNHIESIHILCSCASLPSNRSSRGTWPRISWAGQRLTRDAGSGFPRNSGDVPMEIEPTKNGDFYEGLTWIFW